MRHLLSTTDLDRAAAIRVLDTAAQMSATQGRQIKKLPTLRGRTVVNLFFEDSTRTRISFETAAKRLSADVINFSAKGSSVSKGESLKDTALTLEAMGADAIVIRHQASGAPHTLAHAGWTNAAVVNAGDGMHQHPTQALLDAFTIRRHLRGDAANPDGVGLDLAGLHIALVGDVLHSRVARSNIMAFQKMGAKVTLAGPPTLIPRGIETMGCEVRYTLDDLGQADVVYALRMQNERMDESWIPSIREYATWYQVNGRRLSPKQILMHPGPVNRGVELSAEVVDSPQAVITAQVAAGVVVRMAVLYEVLAHASSTSSPPSPVTGVAA